MKLTQHPLSAAWPAMQADEFQSLKDSISHVGVQNPITLFEGQVIDGWHRYTAANEVGMNCPSKLLGDVDPVDFVISQNEARRHVTASQRALAVSASYAWKPAHRPSIKSAPGAEYPELIAAKAIATKSAKELAYIAGVGTRTMEQAKVVEAKATPEVKAAVRAGTMSIKAAAETTAPAKRAKAARVVVEDPATPPEDIYTPLDAAQDQIEELQAMLAVANLGTIAEEDKDQAKNLIAELRAEVKTLQAVNRALTISRDGFQNQVAEMQRQINRQRREIDRATGQKTA